MIFPVFVRRGSPNSSSTGWDCHFFFAPYAAFGLRYDAASDEMAFQGQRVRRFLDIRQSNGEPLDSGRFHGSMTSIVCCDDDQGEVDVEVIRDYTKPDANGDGALIGMMAERVR